MKLELIRTIISEVMQTDASGITANTDFEQDLDADSMEVFRILIEVERVFCRAFDFSDTDFPSTVQDVLELLD